MNKKHNEIKYSLDFISDNDFDLVVSELFEKAISAKVKMNDKKFHERVIDPLSSLIEISAFDLSYDDWKKGEQRRQIQKTLNNAIGGFHQKLLGKVSGWEDLGTGGGIDLVNEDKKIIAEIKNKHNTVPFGKEKDVYTELLNLVMPKNSKYKDFTAYYVKIIPSKPERYNKNFTPSDKETGIHKPDNPLIKVIDGYSFYNLVTDKKNAYEKIFQSIPLSILKNYDKEFTNFDNIKSLFDKAYVDPNPKLFK